MRIDTFKCDVCGQIKGENNHWFRIDSDCGGLSVGAWNTVLATSTTVDLCSDACVIRVVQKWLTAQAHSTAPLHPALQMPVERVTSRVV
jgi:hypothetical protein